MFSSLGFSQKETVKSPEIFLVKGSGKLKYVAEDLSDLNGSLSCLSRIGSALILISEVFELFYESFKLRMITLLIKMMGNIIYYYKLFLF